MFDVDIHLGSLESWAELGCIMYRWALVLPQLRIDWCVFLISSRELGPMHVSAFERVNSVSMTAAKQLLGYFDTEVVRKFKCQGIDRNSSKSKVAGTV